ncbi:hypothetical protein Dred_2648 [Desulforamulus reducens MI-1]|uniref:Uncharacterized protein n=2 Tax=Desulforamulus TaxID=2916693 RepID=A4J7V1_DESRM|nr:hypothetical protein Dred_2648 [Desulforamulus reducens MI-1]
MLSPQMDPKELKLLIPLLAKEDMEDLLKEIDDLIHYEQDAHKLMRLFDNKEILEKAINHY